MLADITVGYMGGEGKQWLLVRNERGEELLQLLGDEVRTRAPSSAGKRAGPVKGFKANTERAAGGLPLRRKPDGLRLIVGWLMPRVGPRALEFARARVEMKAVKSVIHLRREEPRRLKSMVPAHVWALVAPYGMAPTPEEKPGPAREGLGAWAAEKRARVSAAHAASRARAPAPRTRPGSGARCAARDG